MRCCERLRRDHDVIREVVTSLEAILALEARGRDVPPTLFAGAIEFFTAFVERCHEVMEERILFPLLVDLGMLDGGSLRMVENDREEGRPLLAGLRRLSGRANGSREVSALLAAYVALQRRHLEHEHRFLTPRVEEALTASQDAELQAGFDRIEEAVFGRGGRDALLALGGALTLTCRALGEEHPDGGPQPTVLHLLRPPQETVEPGESLSRAAELMELLAARELAVVERGALVGILTRTDLEPHRGHFEWTQVRTAMTPDPVTVAPDCPIPAVARVLLDHGFNGVAVVADGRFFGLIRRSDLLRALSEDHPNQPPAGTGASRH